MIIVDDKGKLFGYINIIDFFAIVLVLAIAIVGIVFVSHKKTAEIEKDHYIVKVRAINLGPEVAETIQKGLIVRYPDGIEFGVVLDLPIVKPTEVYVTTPEGMLITRTQPKMMDASFSILCAVSRGSTEIKYGNQSFKAGSTGFIESNFTKYTIAILSIEPITSEVALEKKNQLQIELTPPPSREVQSSTPEEPVKKPTP